MFNNTYKDKTVLITGIKGFKGSWLAFWLNKLGAKVVGYSEFPKYERNSPVFLYDYLYYILEIDKIDKNYLSGEEGHNILDYPSLYNTFQKHQPDIVFHLAAQPIVKDSYTNITNTYSTNVIGTLNVLEAAMATPSVKVFVNVTTDKVYDNVESEDKLYNENDPLARGGDPYSSSKACAEILTQSFKDSFLTASDSFSLVTARSGNVIGGGDWHYRLLPQTVCDLHNRNPIRVVLNKSYRPWMYIFDTLAGYLRLGQVLLENKKRYERSFNFAPNAIDACTVNRLVKLIVENWTDLPVDIVKYEQLDGFNQANILQLDNLLAKTELGIYPVYSTSKAVKDSVNWYKAYFNKNREELLELSHKQLNDYINVATNMHLAWTV